MCRLPGLKTPQTPQTLQTPQPSLDCYVRGTPTPQPVAWQRRCMSVGPPGYRSELFKGLRPTAGQGPKQRGGGREKGAVRGCGGGCGCCCPLLPHLDLLLAQLRHTSSDLASVLAQTKRKRKKPEKTNGKPRFSATILGLGWPILGAMLAHLGAMLTHRGVILTQLGGYVGPS